MDTFEEATPALKCETMTDAVCWECGNRLVCHEYVVCCTGTLFHICPDCEAKVRGEESRVPATTATLAE